MLNSSVLEVNVTGSEESGYSIHFVGMLDDGDWMVVPAPAGRLMHKRHAEIIAARLVEMIRNSCGYVERNDNAKSIS